MSQYYMGLKALAQYLAKTTEPLQYKIHSPISTQSPSQELSQWEIKRTKPVLVTLTQHIIHTDPCGSQPINPFTGPIQKHTKTLCAGLTAILIEYWRQKITTHRQTRQCFKNSTHNRFTLYHQLKQQDTITQWHEYQAQRIFLQPHAGYRLDKISCRLGQWHIGTHFHARTALQLNHQTNKTLLARIRLSLSPFHCLKSNGLWYIASVKDTLNRGALMLTHGPEHTTKSSPSNQAVTRTDNA